jgi:YhcH/YjgK/YiaL family protein
MTDERNNPLKSEKWLVEDINEFEMHYSQNKDRWDKALAWFKSTDLNAVAAGKYPIDGDNLYASVSDYRAKSLEDTRFEAHRRYIDIQYLVRGEELIGVAPLSKGKAITLFDAEKDVGFFEIPEEECKYYEAEPGKYFIFFPGDAHRPGIRVNDDAVRKVVVKVRK